MADDETFKITDRRRRDPSVDTPGDPPQPAPTPPLPPSVTEGAAAPGSTAQPHGGPDLQGFFIMLASTALVNLGAAADPGTGERVLDLEQAKEAIDLLSLLRVKTEGNRTDQENHLLGELLYDLQLRFVRAARGESAGD